MRTVGNILWLVLAGWWLALAYVIAGVIACILIITIPFGLASFRLANYVLWPFGRRAVFRQDAGVLAMIGNVVWIVFAGIWLVLGHITTAIALAVTIVGIPLAIANLKIIPVTLAPLGKQIVPSSQVFALMSAAFRHCDENPPDCASESGICRNAPSVLRSAYTSSVLNRPRKATSRPNSFSVTTAGRSSVFPRVFFEIVPPPTEYVSYCQEKPGRRPAVPRAARTLRRSIPGIGKSSEMMYAPETR